MGTADPSAGSGSGDPRVVPFGKYLLLDKIAVGGMAEVFTAKSFGIEGFEKIVAIKRILPAMAEDGDFISMFIDEAKIAGQLTHANVVPIYELAKIGEAHYIAMEYVWGKDLLQIMNRFRRMRRYMPPVMAAWVSSKMLEGLDYAHRKRDREGRPMGIIHRDCSPQNILVSYEGQVKIIDFGIAKAASRTTKTQAGVLKGKFGYMSPEQVRGNAVDHRSDVFAASTCLHEMLTGERLFVGESDFATLEKVRAAKVTPPSATVKEMPSELEMILLKGLSREPEQRWQTAGEMQEALQQFIAQSRPPFGTSKLSTWMRTAFAPEIAKEKARLDSFAKVRPPTLPEPGAATGPLDTPAVPPRRPVGGLPAAGAMTTSDQAALGGDPESLSGEATVVSPSPFDETPADAAAVSVERVRIAEQPTQIFFSSAEIEVPPEARGPLPPLSPSSGLPAPAAPPPSVETAPREDVNVTAPAPTPSGGVARDAAPETFRPTAPGRPERRGPSLWVLAAIGVIGLLLGGALAIVTILALGSLELGRIEVRTAPGDAPATVFLDDEPRGATPLALDDVEPGRHTVTLRAEGHQDAVREVELGPGATVSFELALVPVPEAPAALAPVAAAPTPAAEASVEEAEARPVAPPTEGPPAVTQPASVTPVAAGPSERPGPRSPRTPAAVTPRPARTGAVGYLTVSTIPWARLFVDGRDTGRNTPVRRLRLPAGNHALGLRTQDGEMHRLQVEVEAGREARVVRELGPAG